MTHAAFAYLSPNILNLILFTSNIVIVKMIARLFTAFRHPYMPLFFPNSGTPAACATH